MFSIRKKVGIFAIVTVLTAGLALTGCGKTDNGSGENQDGSALSGSIQLAGSTSVQPLAEELAAAFMEKNPAVKIDVQGGGSSAGVKSVADGVANIGMASRALKNEEESLGLVPVVIAKDGIAVVVNSNNPVADLTMEQIKGIFEGKITNWSEVGGGNGSIVIINREEGSGTRDAFQELVLGKEGKFTESAAIQNSTGAVRTAVSSDPNAIGYISLGALNATVKALQVDGVMVSEENVINDSYQIARPFNFLTKGDPAGLEKAFIDWVLSAEGQEVVGEEFVPLQ